MSKSSNEKEIRDYVKSILNKQFKDGFTFDEFIGGCLSTRPDLATFTKTHILLTEIKSDKDVLTNLENQCNDYSNNSDFVYLILDIVHYDKYTKNKNKYRKATTYFYKEGKLYFDDLIGEVNEFKYHNIYKSNNINALYMLWGKEQYEFFYFLKGRSKILNKTNVIEYLYTLREIIDISYSIIYDRMTNRNNNNVKLQYSEGIYRGKIEHQEHKQILFDSIKCRRTIKTK